MSSASVKLVCLVLLFGVFAHGAPTKNADGVTAEELARQEDGGKADSVESKDLEGELKEAQADKSPLSPAHLLEDNIPQDALSSLENIDDLAQDKDDDVKAVLKTFFQSLKNHPAMVEALIEEESEKLLQAMDSGDVTLHSEEAGASIPSPPQPAHPVPEKGTKRPSESNEDLLMISNGDAEPQGAGKDTAGQVVAGASQGMQSKPPLEDGKTFQKVDMSNAIPRLPQGGPPAAGTQEDQLAAQASQHNNKVIQTIDDGSVDLLWDRESLERLQSGDPFINPLPLFPQTGQGAKPQTGDVISIPVVAGSPPAAQDGAKASPSKPKDAAVSVVKGAAVKSKQQGAENEAAPEGDGEKSAGKGSGAKPVKVEQDAGLDSVPFYYYYYFYDEPVENTKPPAAGNGAGKNSAAPAGNPNGKPETVRITSLDQTSRVAGPKASGKDNSHHTDVAADPAGKQQGAASGKETGKDDAKSGPASSGSSSSSSSNSISDSEPAAKDGNKVEDDLKNLLLKSIQKAKVGAM